MEVLSNKTITDVRGILASGISIGIKKDSKKDICIIYSEHKANSAAVFTSNVVKAPPLLIDMENIKNNNTQAIIINSGNANSCTGSEGLRNAQRMVDITAKRLNLSPKEVLVASTGGLCKQLPMDILVPGIDKACAALSDNGGLNAAEAILSTDTCTKTTAVQFNIKGRNVIIAGMTKGSTMIHPNMGTTLTFMVTDANVSKPLLHKALKKSINDSYNMISVDGDTSTNDMAIILANGASKHDIIETENKDYEEFCKALSTLCTELAKMIVKDGEGSTKFIEVMVKNADTRSDARAAARAVVSSNLIKCEMFGSALKSSTVSCVLGYSGVALKPENYDIFISNNEAEEQIVKESIETNYQKEKVDSILSGDLVKVTIDLKNGIYSATAWGCDLTDHYVKANAYML